MSELPEWIEQRLDENLQRDLRQRTVAEIVWESEEPYLSRTVIQQRVRMRKGERFDKSTINRRLSELVDQNVLMSHEVAGGTIYWIRDDRSEWPIPPDVDPEPVSDEMTVQEFFNSRPVKLGFTGVGSILISSLIFWFGARLSSGETVAGLQATDILAVGFVLIFAGWFIIGSSVIWWFANNPTLRN